MNGIRKRALALGCAAAAVWAGAGEDLTPEAILRKTDEARGNLTGVRWRVELAVNEGGRTNSQAYAVRARGHDFLAEAVEPLKLKGNKVLMVKGNMWFHKPDLSKPVPISQRQKLTGNAAYGDIAATNYAQDYEPGLLPDETVGDEACFVFDLKANTTKATYDRIRYWVSRDRLVALKAEYFTVSGKKFKSAVMEYANTVDAAAGERRPFISRMLIKDELMTSDTTVMSFSDPMIEEIPPRLFDVNRLTD